MSDDKVSQYAAIHYYVDKELQVGSFDGKELQEASIDERPLQVGSIVRRIVRIIIRVIRVINNNRPSFGIGPF